jgi:hypothetical protein
MFTLTTRATSVLGIVMRHEYIEVPGGTHASAGRLNIDKVFALLDQQRKP